MAKSRRVQGKALPVGVAFWTAAGLCWGSSCLSADPAGTVASRNSMAAAILIVAAGGRARLSSARRDDARSRNFAAWSGSPARWGLAHRTVPRIAGMAAIVVEFIKKEGNLILPI